MADPFKATLINYAIMPTEAFLSHEIDSSSVEV